MPYTDIGYTFVMLQALLKYVECIQKIVYAPGSLKVVGKFALDVIFYHVYFVYVLEIT